MTIARRQLLDRSVARWYHCATRCVRREFLLAEGPTNRKGWIENRVKELAETFAVGIGGFSVMDNHIHLLLRFDSDVAQGWSDEDVVRRWGRLFPPRDKSRKPLPVSNDWVQKQLKDVSWVAMLRERLHDLGWFMKCLKEPLARLANREDKARGAFFRVGKARISAEQAGVFERLGSRADNWQLRMEKLQRGRLFGRFFAASREKLQEVAAHLGVRRVANLASCPAR